MQLSLHRPLTVRDIDTKITQVLPAGVYDVEYVKNPDNPDKDMLFHRGDPCLVLSGTRIGESATVLETFGTMSH